MCIPGSQNVLARHLFLMVYALHGISQKVPMESRGYYLMPQLNKEAYVKEGDINIGVLMPIYASSDVTEGRCEILHDTYSILQSTEAVAFAVDQINNNDSILPGVRLGFVVLDSCSSASTALGQSLAFLPHARVVEESYDVDTCYNSSSTSSATSSQSSTSSPTSAFTTSLSAAPDDALGNYDVIGVVGPQRSDHSIAISLLYSQAQLPLISYQATSDELSDEYNHPYFMRVVPADKNQVYAMLHFIDKMGWTYMSVIYHSGSYGETAFENIRALSLQLGICIANSYAVHETQDMTSVTEGLLETPRARVVILFTSTSVVRALLNAVRILNAVGHFIWIGSDAWAISGTDFEDFVDEISGAFTFSFYSTSVPEFERYLWDQTLASSDNPWFGATLEDVTGCSLERATCDGRQLDRLPLSDINSNIIDAVTALGYGAHSLLMTLCPNVNGSQARDCINGPSYLRHLRNTTFQGYTGTIRFDEHGDMIGRYVIKQIIQEFKSETTASQFTTANRTLSAIPIATYDISTSDVIYDAENKVSWKYSNPLERLKPFTFQLSTEIPESVCSRPCTVGEFKILTKLSCCWECRRCRENERLVDDQTRCEVCPTLTWPDPDTNLTVCESISPFYPALTDTMPLVQICFGVLAVLCTLAVIVVYVVLRDVRVIKSSSRELSFLQLLAILVGYVTVIVFQIPPGPQVCTALYVCYCLSFTWLYSSLLVKAVRVYRIFESSLKYNRKPRFVSPLSQLVMAAVLSTIQVVICIVVTRTHFPLSSLVQPVATEKFVELSCDMTLKGLASFLAYNGILVLLCSVFAFKTRQLPDNFNESRLLFMCVSTTLVIWMTFVPTYLTADRGHVRVLLLSVALLLNHSVAIVFLFLPKIYAGLYLSRESETAQNLRFRTTTSLIPPSFITSSRISPTSREEQSRSGFC